MALSINVKTVNNQSLTYTESYIAMHMVHNINLTFVLPWMIMSYRPIVGFKGIASTQYVAGS
jgi:hypothetical protein